MSLTYKSLSAIDKIYIYANNQFNCAVSVSPFSQKSYMLRKQGSYRKLEIKFKDKNFQAPNHFFQGSFYFIDSDFNTAPQHGNMILPEIHHTQYSCSTKIFLETL